MQDNYIFVISNDKIIKININDYSVLEEKDLRDSGYYMIKSTTNGAASSIQNIWSVNYTTTLEAPVFCNEDKKVIARFNSETLEFEKIIDVSEYEFSYPYGQEAFIVDWCLQYDKYLVIQLQNNLQLLKLLQSLYLLRNYLHMNQRLSSFQHRLLYN
mgnify:CR=1 FL=1